MVDRMAQATDRLAARLKSRASTDVTLRRGVDSATVSARLGQTLFQLSDQFGMITPFESRDFIILAADYDLGAGSVEPAIGDRFDVVQAGKTYTFECLSPGGEDHWRWADAHHREYRVHTKLVGTA